MPNDQPTLDTTTSTLQEPYIHVVNNDEAGTGEVDRSGSQVTEGVRNESATTSDNTDPVRAKTSTGDGTSVSNEGPRQALPLQTCIAWKALPPTTINTWDSEVSRTLIQKNPDLTSTNQRILVDRLKKLNLNRAKFDNTARYNTTEVMTKWQWDSMSDKARRELFRKKNILIKADRRPAEDSGYDDPFGLKEMSRLIDAYAQLQALGKTLPRVIRHSFIVV